MSNHLAPPLNHIFADRAEADWGFEFLRRTLERVNAGVNSYRPCVLTLPKSHKRHLLRLNFGPWLLVDLCGPASLYGKRINLALLQEDFPLDSRRQWDVFHYPQDWRGVALYHFTWEEVQAMEGPLMAHYAASMEYIGDLFARWRGSPYRLAHQSQIFEAIFDPATRNSLLNDGIDPFFVDQRRQHERNGESVH